MSSALAFVVASVSLAALPSGEGGTDVNGEGRRPRQALDAVAAVVERRVVTTSEIEAEARLVLLDRAGAEVAAGSLDAGLLHKVLDSVVMQELLALEARRTGIAVREVDIDKSVEAVRARLGQDVDVARTFLQRFGIDEELLRSRARRDLAAQALLQKVFSEVKVSDDEAAALASSQNLADVDAVAAARATLERERRDARFRTLIEAIRRSTEVRVVWRP